ncbi:hypothetical protein [Methyloglobulus sp.]|uniref:hypothetical protein n=1 Tax=Methyloglobulus sp. TaxID=2518622 RepID=UPI0039891B6C
MRHLGRNWRRGFHILFRTSSIHGGRRDPEAMDGNANITNHFLAVWNPFVAIFTSLCHGFRQVVQVPTCLPHFRHPWRSSMPE